MINKRSKNQTLTTAEHSAATMAGHSAARRSGHSALYRKGVLLTGCVLTAALILGGCSSKSSSASYVYDSGTSYSTASSYGYAEDFAYADDYDYEVTAGESELLAVNSGSGSDDSLADSLESETETNEDDAASAGRKLIRNVSLDMQTLDYDGTISQIEQRVAAVGGYIQSSNSYSNNYYSGSYRHNRYAYYTVRIPAAALDSFISAVGDMGTISSQSMTTEDVTLSYVDFESRVYALRLQQERLLELLEKADNMTDIIALEDSISDVTYELERYESILRNYDNLVSYSTVNISIDEVERITVEDTETFGQRISSGLSDSFYELGQSLTDFAAGFIINLPYIVIWAVIIALIVFIIIRIVKKVRRHRKAAGSSKSGSPAADSTASEALPELSAAEPADTEKKQK